MDTPGIPFVHRKVRPSHAIARSQIGGHHANQSRASALNPHAP